jgi:hypothetical protein
LGRLLIHTFSLLQAASTTGDYGHATQTWTGTGTVTTTGIACRYQPRVEREAATGAVISDYVLYADYASVPASLLAHGAESTHRVSNILDAEGASLDAGPFDVLSIQDQAGSQHHLKLALKRIG